MGIYTRPDSPYYWVHFEGTKRRENTKVLVQAPTDAERRENRQLAESIYHAGMADRARQQHHLPSKKSAATFRAFVEWYKAHELPSHRGKERELDILPRLVAVFGAYDLREIRPDLVFERWITPRRTETRTVGKRTIGPPTTNTINREVDVLKSVLSAGVPTYYDQSPLYGLPRLRVPTPKRRLLTDAEEARLLAIMEPDDKALFLIGLDSLVRLSDILDAKHADVQDGTLWVADPKAGGGFRVPLSTRAREALAHLPASASPYLFPRRRRAVTERDRRNGIRQMLEMYCRLADPPVPYGRANGGITFHWATRRTGTTRMLTRGVDPGTVQKIGRWKTSDVVLGIYHELIDEAAQHAVEVVGAPAAPPARSRHVHDIRKSGRKTG